MFMLQGRRIEVRNGVCVTTDGTLAGSNLDMAQAVRNAVSLLGLQVEQALAMASLHPAQFLGLRACLTVLNDALEVTAAWIDGVREEA
jgi:N-acetylglucosamine-6-phosphate deacetylase